VKTGSFKLTKIAGNLRSPVYVTNAGDGSGRLFIVEQAGRILVLKSGSLLATPFLDIRSLVASGGERGLLSVAFHPDFASNGVFVVNYTRASSQPALVGDTILARYRVSPAWGDVADRASGQTLLAIDQPQANHNGGLVMFAPDGTLYIGMGDGGAGGDQGAGHAPQGNGQSLTTMLGKLLRISVGATGPYTIPSNNPNLGSGTRREIWAYGLRNPWRFSFDRATGDLYIADVGQNAWEEVDFQPATSQGRRKLRLARPRGHPCLSHRRESGAVCRSCGRILARDRWVLGVGRLRISRVEDPGDVWLSSARRLLQRHDVDAGHVRRPLGPVAAPIHRVIDRVLWRR
jgi:hypothetical protein